MTTAALALFLSALFLSPGVKGPEEAFLEGNRLYLKGAFEAALEAYEEALEFKKKPGLIHYNAGNCLFRLGRYGEALYQYLSARFYRPRHPGVIGNAKITRARLGLGWPSGLGLAKMLIDRFNFFTFFEYLAAAGFSLSLMLLLWTLFLLKRSRAARYAASVCAGFTLVFVLLGVAVASHVEGRWGLAVKACEVLNEPSPAAGDVLFFLREGEEVRIEESREGWHRVEGRDDQRGWVRNNEVLPLP